MGRPAVSVLMTVHNSQRFIDQAVRSVLAQDFSDLELIVVDDGSTDRTARKLTHLARQDDRLKVITQPNRGIPIAANAGLEHCRGRYVARLDSDDLARSDRIRRQVAYLEANDAVCVGSDMALIDPRGRFLTVMHNPPDDASIQAHILRGHAAIGHTSCLIRGDAIERIGGYDERFTCGVDLDLWLRLGEIGALANISEPLVQYRLHDKSISEREGRHQREMFYLACQLAWARRGIEGRFDAWERWRPAEHRGSRHRFMLRYGWWALTSQQRRTAAIYGVKALLAGPGRAAGWKLLACSALKSRSALSAARQQVRSARDSIALQEGWT